MQCCVDILNHPVDNIHVYAGDKYALAVSDCIIKSMSHNVTMCFSDNCWVQVLSRVNAERSVAHFSVCPSVCQCPGP